MILPVETSLSTWTESGRLRRMITAVYTLDAANPPYGHWFEIDITNKFDSYNMADGNALAIQCTPELWGLVYQGVQLLPDVPKALESTGIVLYNEAGVAAYYKNKHESVLSLSTRGRVRFWVDGYLPANAIAFNTISISFFDHARPERVVNRLTSH